MRLVSFILRRALHSIFVLLGLSIVIFIISRVLPGDPVRMAAGARAPQWVVDNMREQMHLNDPLPVQYGYWLMDALQGRFGISLVTRREVADDIREFFPATLELALFSGVMMGGLRPGTRTSSLITWCVFSLTWVWLHLRSCLPLSSCSSSAMR